jgi:hypothetical protein
VVAAMSALVLVGFWPFHRGPSPQEKLYQALSRGNSAEAGLIWTGMSEDDKTLWMQGRGFSPNPSDDDIKDRIAEHYRQFTTAAGGSQTIESPDSYFGGLEQLQQSGVSAGVQAPASPTTK